MGVKSVGVKRGCCSCKERMFLGLSQNSRESACVRVSLLSFIEREVLAWVFSFGFCEISGGGFFAEHLCTTASVSGSFRSIYATIYYIMYIPFTFKSKIKEKLKQQKMICFYPGYYIKYNWYC